VRIVSRPVREALPPPPSARGEYSHEDIRRRIDAMPWPKPR
jgi:hypothetical protein